MWYSDSTGSVDIFPFFNVYGSPLLSWSSWVSNENFKKFRRVSSFLQLISWEKSSWPDLNVWNIWSKSWMGTDGFLCKMEAYNESSEAILDILTSLLAYKAAIK